MMRGVVVCGGDLCPRLLPERHEGQLWIAADSGLKYLEGHGIVPDIAVGDWDSLGRRPEGLETVSLDVRKDDTDLVAALRLGYERGCTFFTILGALGGKRFSHSLAAVQALHWLKTLGADGEILDENCRIYVLGGGEGKDFPPELKGHISVFSLTDRACVSMRGLWYSGEKIALESSFPLGVSNAFSGTQARIECVGGCVGLVIEEE